MDYETFSKLPTQQVAQLVRESGPKVCVFPINGTRRWFTLEHGGEEWGDPVAAYMDLAGLNHVGLYRLFFEHGLDTLLTPVFGADILQRSDEYVQRVAKDGLRRMADHPTFTNFYDEYDVRVHFYGDYRRGLAGTELAYLCDLFEAAAERTRGHQRFRLFIGVFASDATQTVAEFSAKYYEEHRSLPDKRQLVEMVYGEYVAPVDFFIGFDRFSAYDMPLLATGQEDLYFTVSPSPYMEQAQLRRILFDHLYTRRAPDPEYGDLPAQELQEIRNFYLSHREYTMGTGKLLHGIWIPELYD